MKFDSNFAVLFAGGVSLITTLILLAISIPKAFLVGAAVVTAFAVLFIIGGFIGGHLN